MINSKPTVPGLLYRSAKRLTTRFVDKVFQREGREKRLNAIRDLMKEGKDYNSMNLPIEFAQTVQKIFINCENCANKDCKGSEYEQGQGVRNQKETHNGDKNE